MTISVKTVARSLFRDRLFNRMGNSFASTRASQMKHFRTTSNKALFLSRVTGLPCRLRTGLLAIVRGHCFVGIKDGAPRPAGVQLVYTAGHGLSRVMRGKRFHRSLLCHVGAVRLRVPTLQRQGRSVLPLTRHFLRRCGRRCLHALANFDTSTRRHLLGCP